MDQAQTLRARMQALGLSEMALESHSGVSRGAIRRVLAGENTRPSTWRELAEVLHHPPLAASLT